MRVYCIFKIRVHDLSVSTPEDTSSFEESQNNEAGQNKTIDTTFLYMPTFCEFDFFILL